MTKLLTIMKRVGWAGFFAQQLLPRSIIVVGRKALPTLQPYTCRVGRLCCPPDTTFGVQPTQLRSHPAHQSGVVLIVSLIMLLLLTIIGTVGMQTTSLEEKMAGNSRDRNLAFQAAEAALRAGEANTATIVPSGYYEGSMSPIDWADSKVKTYLGVSLIGANQAQPQYIIEKPTKASAGGSGSGPKSIEAGTGKTGTAVMLYRITARGKGGTSDAVVVVQSMYKR
jgi:type IV pilus assembly protein PilX